MQSDEFKTDLQSINTNLVSTSVDGFWRLRDKWPEHTSRIKLFDEVLDAVIRIGEMRREYGHVVSNIKNIDKRTFNRLQELTTVIERECIAYVDDQKEEFAKAVRAVIADEPDAVSKLRPMQRPVTFLW